MEPKRQNTVIFILVLLCAAQTMFIWHLLSERKARQPLTKQRALPAKSAPRIAVQKPPQPIPAQPPARSALPPVPVQQMGKIAIVIDDWGYTLSNLKTAEELGAPITASVLPRLGHSKTVADELCRRGFEVILHLPMEPMEKMNLEKNTILVGMDKPAVTAIINNAIAGISCIKGVSNHMGSRATADATTMSYVTQALKGKNLYFLDSLVSASSVARSSARENNIPFAKRDVFLDNQEDAQYIRGQIRQLKKKARLNGQAIGIGHDRHVTFEVLKEEIPKMEKEGYELVVVSQLSR